MPGYPLLNKLEKHYIPFYASLCRLLLVFTTWWQPVEQSSPIELTQSNNFKIHDMKQLFSFLITSLFLTCISNSVIAQNPREAEIRRLENLERESALKADSAVLFDKIWSPNMLINTPANEVGTVEGSKAKLRSGNLDYLSFERNIEKITFNDNVAIVMGGETIKPKAHQANAGKTVSRRFTNVWLYKNNRWSMIARQATIIKVE
ncbi:MAG: nuclear transport factor 2 family protein [Sphingobacteriales bacterium]|nr:nuclear transport factor 2 family protein [Sphingobacteriales bacterium]